MKWQTGIVMERIGRHTVIMTPTGEFKRVKITGRIPDIGEEIRVPVQSNLFRMPRTSWAAVAAAVILMLVASPLLTFLNQPPEVAAAYVAIDINPSVELTVSNYDNVLNVHAYNSDGQKVLTGLDLRGVNYKNAVAQIGKRAVELGYVTKESDNTVVISVSPLPNARVNKVAMETALMASVDSVLTDSRVRGEVRTLHVPAGIRETATKRGISPAKYAVLLEAVNAGLPVTEKDMQEKSIKVAIASAGGSPDQIINQAEEENKFEDKEQKYFALLSRTNRETSGEQSDQNNSGADVTSVAQNDNSDAGSEVDNDKQGRKKPAVDPVRRAGNPEDSTDKPDNTGGGHGQVPAVAASPAEKPGSTGTAVSGTKPEGGNTPGSDTVTTPEQDSTQDENTDQNYMGAPIDKSPDNDNPYMNVLKPNF